MRTANEMSGNVGRQGIWSVEGLTVQVQIIDARQVWDRTDYLIQPVNGSGSKWVSAARVHVPKAEAVRS